MLKEYLHMAAMAISFMGEWDKDKDNGHWYNKFDTHKSKIKRIKNKKYKK